MVKGTSATEVGSPEPPGAAALAGEVGAKDLLALKQDAEAYRGEAKSRLEPTEMPDQVLDEARANERARRKTTTLDDSDGTGNRVEGEKRQQLPARAWRALVPLDAEGRRPRDRAAGEGGGGNLTAQQTKADDKAAATVPVDLTMDLGADADGRPALRIALRGLEERQLRAVASCLVLEGLDSQGTPSWRQTLGEPTVEGRQQESVALCWLFPLQDARKPPADVVALRLVLGEEKGPALALAPLAASAAAADVTPASAKP